MNEETRNHAHKLLADGAEPTAIFHHLLQRGGESRQDHFHLVHDLRLIFDMSVDSLLMIGAWDRWKKGGYDEATLNKKLEGKMQPKIITPGA